MAVQELHDLWQFFGSKVRCTGPCIQPNIQTKVNRICPCPNGSAKLWPATGWSQHLERRIQPCSTSSDSPRTYPVCSCFFEMLRMGLLRMPLYDYIILYMPIMSSQVLSKNAVSLSEPLACVVLAVRSPCLPPVLYRVACGRRVIHPIMGILNDCVYE